MIFFPQYLLFCGFIIGCKAWFVTYVVVIKPNRYQILGLVNVAAIYHHISRHGLFYHLPLRQAEFFPLGHNHQCIGIVGGIIDVITVNDWLASKAATRFIHSHRVVNLDFATGSQQRID